MNTQQIYKTLENDNTSVIIDKKLPTKIISKFDSKNKFSFILKVFATKTKKKFLMFPILKF